MIDRAWMTTEDVTLQATDLYPAPKAGSKLAVREHYTRGQQSEGCEDGKPAMHCVQMLAAGQITQNGTKREVIRHLIRQFIRHQMTQQMAPNGTKSKWHQMAQMVQHCTKSKWHQMAQNTTKWHQMQMAPNGTK